MDGFSLLIGGALGVMAGWALSAAATKQREANNKSSKAGQAQKEITQKKQEAKGNRDGKFADTIQGFLLNILGFSIIIILGIILFNSLS